MNFDQVIRATSGCTRGWPPRTSPNAIPGPTNREIVNITGSHSGHVSKEPKMAPRVRTGCFRAMPRTAFMASMTLFASLPVAFDRWFTECGFWIQLFAGHQGSVARVLADRRSPSQAAAGIAAMLQ